MKRTKYPLNTVNSSFLIEYYNQCKSGDILVGKELMMQLEMLIEDMFNPTYRFDLKEARKRIQFIENECRHSISPFAGKPFILELWQKALIEAIYGFYMEIDGQWLRRFIQVLLVIGRKNGKSTFCSALSLAEFFCGNWGTNLMCASNDYDQAGILFDEIDAMREQSPKLSRVSRKNIKGIFMGNPRQKKKAKGKFSYQNKAKIKKLSAKTMGKEGRNLDVVIADETHEMKDDSLILPLKQSMSSKDEPLFIEISTEGFTPDGHLDKTMVEGRQILRRELHRPRTLIWLYTQDSEIEVWQDKKTWVKSNPNLGVSKKWAYLEEMVEAAKTSSSTRAYVLAKDFNIKQGAAESWIQLTDIINLSTFDLKDFAGSFYLSGNDFAETTDLCSSSILFKKPDDKNIYIHTRYWIPESKLKDHPDDVDYRQWEREGWLTIVEGNVVESSMVADWHFELLKEYDMKPYKAGYDNRFAKDFVNRYAEIFGEKITINVPQEAKVLNNPMRALEADMKDKLVNYQNNPVCVWCFQNTGIKLDNLGRVRPVKMHVNKKIDGAVSKIIVYAVYEWYKSEFMALING